MLLLSKLRRASQSCRLRENLKLNPSLFKRRAKALEEGKEYHPKRRGPAPGARLERQSKDKRKCKRGNEEVKLREEPKKKKREYEQTSPEEKGARVMGTQNGEERKGNRSKNT